MTENEKQLLIKDLCARLPYSVFGLHRGEDLPLYIIDNSGAYMVLGYDAWFDLDTVPFKPYLRPMLSMTDSERGISEQIYKDSGFWTHFDWLNEHHFDYRGLIEKGLALEAPKDIY